MKAVAKFYSNGKEMDSSKSITATVEALPAGVAFTAEEVAEALNAIAPTGDEECGDLEDLTRTAQRWLSRVLSNRMSSASQYLCEEQGNVFVRR